MILSPTRLPTQPAYGQRKELFLEVIVQDNESLEGALKRFRRQCQRSGLMAEVRRRSHYVKPSEPPAGVRAPKDSAPTKERNEYPLNTKSETPFITPSTESARSATTTGKNSSGASTSLPSSFSHVKSYRFPFRPRNWATRSESLSPKQRPANSWAK